jgi:WD40 repeat protein
MDTIEAETATLCQLLGRHWTVGAPVTSTVFDPAGEVVGFALADGTLAVAPLADSESPQDRCRVALDGGQTTILPRQRLVPPVTKVVIGDAPLNLSTFGKSGFIVADRGRLLQVSVSGATKVVVDQGSPIDVVAPVQTGGILAASGGTIIFYDSNGEGGWLQQCAEGSPSAMAVSWDGRSFAMGVEGRLLLRAFGPGPEPAASFELGSITSLSWSPDGIWLAVSGVKTGIVLVRLADARIVRIPSYPATVASLSWSADSRHLVTSGAYRMVVWDVSSPGDKGEQPMNLATGRAGFVLVEAVDMHPERPLVAAGYSDGKVTVARIGAPDELVIKPPGEGAIHALRWSRDGQHLAFGTGEGEAAIVTFPPHIFR